MSKYYITTPIYYINDIPHIGHAYTSIAADVLARYHRQKGDEVFLLTGTDEHGAKIAEAAARAGKSPQEFSDELSAKFEALVRTLNISYDQFFRTTNPEHGKLVQQFVQKLTEKGFVDKRKYTGLYCVGCEKFLKEAELEDGCCPDHKKPPVRQTEENYFFKLSEFAEKLTGLIQSGEFEVGPETRKNEVLGKIKTGLEDISISRQAVEWGIRFPSDETQTIYVWIDALLNYYTATEMYGKEEFWPADLHLVGKDILWFHAVIWPALLLAADLPLPKKVFAHGFFTSSGAKMSKTVGNVIDPNEIVKKYGVDAVRYYLLSAFPFGEDGDVSLEKLDLAYNKLANDIGNLLQRVISMIKKYQFNGVILSNAKNLGDPSATPQDDNIKRSQDDTIKKPKDDNINIDSEIQVLDFAGALKKITDFAQAENKYIADKEPWTLAKENKTAELTQVLQHSFDALWSIQSVILPFMPETAEKIRKQLNTLEPEVLFPRIEEAR